MHWSLRFLRGSPGAARLSRGPRSVPLSMPGTVPCSMSIDRCAEMLARKIPQHCPQWAWTRRFSASINPCGFPARKARTSYSGVRVPARCHSQPLGFGAGQDHALDERSQDLNGKTATLVPRLARIEPKHPTGSRSEDAVGLVLGGVDSPVTGPSWGRTRGL